MRTKTLEMYLPDKNDYYEVLEFFKTFDIEVSRGFYSDHYKWLVIFITDKGKIELGGNYTKRYLNDDVPYLSFDKLMAMIQRNVTDLRKYRVVL